MIHYRTRRHTMNVAKETLHGYYEEYANVIDDHFAEGFRMPELQDRVEAVIRYDDPELSDLEVEILFDGALEVAAERDITPR